MPRSFRRVRDLQLKKIPEEMGGGRRMCLALAVSPPLSPPSARGEVPFSPSAGVKSRSPPRQGGVRGGSASDAKHIPGCVRRPSPGTLYSCKSLKNIYGIHRGRKPSTGITSGSAWMGLPSSPNKIGKNQSCPEAMGCPSLPRSREESVGD